MSRLFRLRRLSIHELAIYVFVFLDPLFLPFGLMYSHMYSPLAFGYVAKWSKKTTLFLFFVGFLFLLYTADYVLRPGYLHFSAYVVNVLIFMASVIFAAYVYLYVPRLRDFHGLVKRVIRLKVFLALIALILLGLGAGHFLWRESAANPGSMRLHMFFYEPSIYALVVAPFAVYAVIEFLKKRDRKSLLLVLMAVFPLLLARSAGVIGGIAIATLLCNFRAVARLLSVRNWIVIGIVAAAAFAVAGNFLIGRTARIVEGNDQSGLVRVVYSLGAAEELIEHRGFWLGAGPGEAKYALGTYTSQYRAFGGDRLASSVASTLAAVGVVGLAIKLALMLGLFFGTRSHKCKYSRTLFVFLFIYQFTGGYFNDVNEFVILGFAFGYARRKRVLQAATDVATGWRAGTAALEGGGAA